MFGRSDVGSDRPNTLFDSDMEQYRTFCGSDIRTSEKKHGSDPKLAPELQNQNWGLVFF